ncbi:MAG: hypothetical protein H6R00_585 [Proteobacteria bacterium]|nr:hypothetical protein [Pseudomonadota bacterium]
MPVVPTYEDRGIRLDPGLNFRDSTHATGEMFGSQVGEAMGKAGQGLIDVGKAVAEVEDLDATTTAKDNGNVFIGRANERAYGENGYMNTSGRAGVEGIKSFQADLMQMAKEGAKGLSPLAERRYWDTANVVMNDMMKEAYRHSMAQRPVWKAKADNTRTAVLSDSAVSKPEGSEGVPLMVAAAVAQHDETARDQQLPEQDRLKGNASVVSDIVEARLLKRAETDPRVALRQLELAKGSLPKATFDRLFGNFNKAAVDETTWQGAVAFATGPRAPEEMSPIVGVSDATPAAGPTRQKGFLLDHTAGANAPAVLNLDTPFATNLAALIEDAPAKVRDGLGIGFRKGADDPHGERRAADLTYLGVSLDQAPADVQDWLRRNAGSYGLSLPIGGGPNGSVVASTDGVAVRALRPSAEAIDKHLASIADPGQRVIAQQAIMATLDQQSRQEQQQQQAAKDVLWQKVEDGTAPDALPFPIRQAAGSGAMTVARNYVNKTRHGPIVSDDVLLRDMRLFAAERPEDFARVDLNDYRDRLEGSDLKALAETQSAIGQDSRKARDQGAELKNAFDIAKTRLEDAGALTPGEESAHQRQLLAQVQNTVYAGLADFRTANPGARPTPSDVHKMVDPFLLPYYLPQPDPRRGKPVAKLSDISPDLRASITQQLAMEIDRKPTDGEIAREYAAFMQSQLV